MLNQSLSAAQRRFDNLLPENEPQTLENVNDCLGCGQNQVILHATAPEYPDLSDYFCQCLACKRSSKSSGMISRAIDRWNESNEPQS